MVFSSITFLYYFFPIFLILYFAFYKFIAVQNIIIVVFSLIFYTWGAPQYVILLLALTLINYFCGIYLPYFDNDTFKKKIIITLGITVNVASLFFFKYITAIFKLNIILPMGISFYTLQSISYLVDVYRNDVKAQKNFFYLLLYISMFPQLIAGPIVRYKTIEERITDRKVCADSILSGISIFLVGLGKKVIIANSIGNLLVESNILSQSSVLSSWVGIIFYTIQIYFDFSGYSDIAIGIGKIIGFDFPENFNYPYTATSITDFWRRWHITLSVFFKDYVFMPLNMKIKNVYFNLLIVWILTGMWHGSSINFLLWGLYYFVLLVIEKTFLLKKLRKLPKPLSKTVGFIYTIFFLLIANTIFYFTNLSDIKNAFMTMFCMKGNAFFDTYTISVLKSNIYLIILSFVFATPLIKILNKKLFDFSVNNKFLFALYSMVKVLILITILILSTMLLISETNNPFLYTQF